MIPEGTAIEDFGAEKAAGRGDSLDEGFEHPLGDFKVGDHAIFHRAHGMDFAGGFTKHRFGFMADSENFVCQRIDGDDRGLCQNDPFAPDEDQCVGGTKVDPDIAREKRRESRCNLS